MNEPSFESERGTKFAPIPGRRRQLYQVHPLTIVYEFLMWLRQMAFPLLIFAFFSFRGGDDSQIFEVAASAFAGLRVIAAAINYAISRWGFEEHLFIWKTGVIVKQERTIPIERIQNVEIVRNLAHRILGLADLKIDTGVGGEAEVRLSSLKFEDAQRLQQSLLHRRTGAQDAPMAPAAKEAPVWVATTRDLVYAGLSENRALLIVASFFGLFSFAQFGDNPLEALLRSAVGQFRKGGGLDYWPVFWAGLGLLLAGYVVGIVHALVRYHRFTIRHEGDRIVREFGLFTHLTSAIPLRRVQVLVAVAGWVKRRLGFWETQCATAGSPLDLEASGSNVLCPVVQSDELGRFVQLVFPEIYFDRIRWNRVSPLTIRRHIVRYTLQWTWLVVPAAFTFGPRALWVYLAVIPLSIYAARRKYETVGYGRYLGHTAVHTGLAAQCIALVPDDKIQSLELEQSPFQRRMGLMNLTIATAGQGAGSSLTIEDLEAGQALRLRDELAEATARAGAWQVDGV